MKKIDYHAWEIKVDKPFYAAVDKDGYIISGYESHMIATTRKVLVDHLKMEGRDPKTVSIKRVKIVVEEEK